MFSSSRVDVLCVTLGVQAQRSYTWASELRWKRVNGLERTCHVNLAQPYTHDTPPAGAAVQAHLDEDSAAPMRRAAASCVYG